MHVSVEALRKSGLRARQDPSSSRCITGNVETPGRLPTRSPLRQTSLSDRTCCENVLDKDEETRAMVGRFRS